MTLEKNAAIILDLFFVDHDYFGKVNKMRRPYVRLGTCDTPVGISLLVKTSVNPSLRSHLQD
jgi:hypothetical protein